MGYETARFTSSDIDKDLMCAICMNVLENPVETPCEHHFCEECILPWLQTRHRCPLDNTMMNASQLCQPSRLLSNQLGRLQIACEFRAAGCRETVPLEVLNAHQFKCPHNPQQGEAPPATAQTQLRHRQGRPTYDDDYYADDDDGATNLETVGAVAVGAVAIGAAIGALVGSIIGYKRGRGRNNAN